jgi:hypothetical protein
MEDTSLIGTILDKGTDEDVGIDYSPNSFFFSVHARSLIS